MVKINWENCIIICTRRRKRKGTNNNGSGSGMGNQTAERQQSTRTGWNTYRTDKGRRRSSDKDNNKNMQPNLEDWRVARGLEEISVHTNIQERGCERV